MSDIAISVQRLSKAYRIGLQEQQHETLIGAVAAWGKAPLANFRNLRNLSRFDRAEQDPDIFWALKDLSFDIRAGEAVGIIGRNGAGKSTLLKVLSRITEPTLGKALIHGRVSSLLEVGTGFHPDLTGRENAYLNGTILGMRKREIDAKFDEIVDFSGVEKFIDTPVKRYSTGMRVRLAFAIAAHLEPQILIVDEVLAVGDLEFQKKCLGKMQDVAGHGRTVLFVSHNMTAITNFCGRGMLLSEGAIECDGTAVEAVERYLSDNQTPAGTAWEMVKVPDGDPIFFESAAIIERGARRLVIQCSLQSVSDHRAALVAVDITDAMGVPVMQAMPTQHPFLEPSAKSHELEIDIELPMLIPGLYGVDLWVGAHFSETYSHVRGAIGFEVTTSPIPERTFPHSKDHGSLVALAKMQTTSRRLS